MVNRDRTHIRDGDWKNFMQTEERIRARLVADKEQHAEWEAELAKAAKDPFEESDYLDYCKVIIREYKAIIETMKWVLEEPNERP